MRPVADCDDFRFDVYDPTATTVDDLGQATYLLTQYDLIWELIKWLAIVSSSSAVISVMMVLLIVLEGYRK